MRKTCTISPGRRAPTTSSGRPHSSMHGCRRCRCGCCCSPNTSARPSGTSTRRARAQVLRRVVRPVSVRPHHDRRSGLAERARAAWSIRRSSRPARAGWRRARVAEPEDVTVHEAGHQFWYGVVATNEFEHAWMDEGFNTFSTARTLDQFFEPHYLSKRYFGGFVPWDFEDLPLQPRDRRQSPGGYRDGGRRRCAVHAVVALLARDGRGDHLQQDRAVAEHARAHARLGHAAADPVDLLLALLVQAPRTDRTSSPSPTR